MDEFEKRKIAVLQPIYFEAGAALFDCQSFEYGIAYLLYLFSRLGARGLDTDDLIKTLEHENKKTAGQLIALLKEHLEVSDGIERSLAKALKARNELVHRYMVENVERIAKPSEHKNIVQEIRSLRGQVRKSYKQLRPFVKALAHMLDGISVDDIEIEAKANFLYETNHQV